MDCKNCGLPVDKSDENCPNCGAPNTGVVQPAAEADEAAQPAHKLPFNPVLAVTCGVGVFIIFVVACWLGWTVYAFYHSPSSNAPLAKPLAAPPTSAASDTGPSLAVADIEGGTDADRKGFDGKSVTVDGYVAALSGATAEIADTADGTKPRLKITGSLASVKPGLHAKFTGKYSAQERTLSVDTIHPE